MKTINPNVLRVLAAGSFDGSIMRLTGQLERKLYLETNKVIEALGGKWDRRANGHVFTDDDAAARIDDALLTGTYERPNNFDFFPTPHVLASNVARLALLRPGMRVLEPNAGDGALIDAAIELGDGHGCDVWDITCFEMRPDLREKLIAKGYAVDPQPDFLAARHYVTDSAKPFTPFDRVIMNPPFSTQQDVDHVSEALLYLAADGLLVAIMSAGIEFRQTKKTAALREIILARGGSISRNPEGSFKPSGTNVNTVTVVVPGSGR